MKNNSLFKLAALLFVVTALFSCTRRDPDGGFIGSDSTAFLKKYPHGFPYASDINAALAQAPGGIGLGGVFEGSVANNYDTSFAAVKHHLDDIAAKSFKYVRLEVNWERADRRNGDTIKTAFINQIKRVVDYALTKNLFVIMNMQNHNLLMNNPPAYKNMFLSQWEQIATAFESYSYKLLFEILNEPADSMNSYWNDYYQEALNVIRTTPKPNSNNKYRTVLVGVANRGGVDYVKELDKTPLENDPYTILTIHYYLPMSFTHQNSWVSGSQNWKGTRWDNTAAERNFIAGNFAYAKKLVDDSNIVVNIGEYGSYSEADINSRVRFTDYLMKYFRAQGFSSGFFNYLLNPGFGIYDVNNGYVQPLVDVFAFPGCTYPASGADTPDKDSTLYTSHVTASNHEGWQFYSNDNGASSGTWVVDSNKMKATITSTGSNIYGMILIKTPVTGASYSFQKGVRYYVNFKASSSIPFQRINVATNTGGEAALFYPDATLKQYSYVFRAVNDEPSGYLKFYIGADPGASSYTITISDVEVHQYDFSNRPYPQF